MKKKRLNNKFFVKTVIGLPLYLINLEFDSLGTKNLEFETFEKTTMNF